MTPRHIQGTRNLNYIAVKTLRITNFLFPFLSERVNFEACINQKVILQPIVMENSQKYRSLLTECNKIQLQSKWRDLLVRLFNDAVKIKVY